MDATVKVAEVAASGGARWLGQAFKLFTQAPLTWIGLCAGWIVITFGLMMVPLIGMVASNFLQPVFFASFAICAYKQSAGERITMNDLFTGFRHHIRALINLGALLLLAQLLILVIMAMLGLPTANAGDRESTIAEYVELLKGKEWILAIGFLLTVIIKGALWFAPPLIAFHGMSTTQAMRWSLFAAVSNLGAMMVYGTVLLGLFIVGLIPWALGLLVVIPLAAISTYIGYREVFETA
ncbi:MAG TPA: BPSS1780 family membrane protein [Usitatibacter sp.]|nr:BPSS1780 family membrane protein [Usitatibacter sp.]